jgi:hypothetical protein
MVWMERIWKKESGFKVSSMDNLKPALLNNHHPPRFFIGENVGL